MIHAGIGIGETEATTGLGGGITTGTSGGTGAGAGAERGEGDLVILAYRTWEYSVIGEVSHALVVARLFVLFVFCDRRQSFRDGGVHSQRGYSVCCCGSTGHEGDKL